MEALAMVCMKAVFHISLQSGKDGALPNSVRNTGTPYKSPFKQRSRLAEKRIRLVLFSIPAEKYHFLSCESLFIKLHLAGLRE
jgi:hypothetical protein